MQIQNYTQFVRLAKWVLGILIMALIAMMLFYSFVKSGSDVRVAFTSVQKTSKPPPTEMLKANYHGFDKNNQPYDFSALTALQTDEDTMEFDKFNGSITTTSGTWCSVQSDKGSMKIKEHLLTLNGSVEMFDDAGYEVRTDHMQVDISKKIATSTDPVEGQGPLGTIKSHGMVFYGNTKDTVFGGPVLVTVYMAPKSTVKKEDKDQ